jgi:glycosyltransferase involved in cell wall biosynthesis
MKIKLLIIVTSYQSVVTILESKIALLAQNQEVDVSVASSDDDQNENRKTACVFFPVQSPRTIQPFNDLKAIFRLIWIIKKNKFNIIHTHTAKAGIVGAIAGRFCKVPVLHTYHGLPFYSNQNNYAHFLYKSIETAASKIRQAVFSQTRHDLKEIACLKGFNCKSYYEGNGVCVEHVIDNGNRHLPFVDAVFSASDQIHILCVARLEPVKHIETVIASIDYLNSKGSKIDCVIAGKGPVKDSLESLIKKKNLENQIKILYTPYIHSIIKKSDIVVLSSIKEGIPRSIMEAMCFKKPALATNVAGTNELILDKITGFLTPFGDQKSFNEALEALAHNNDLRIQFGQAGFKRIVKEFTEHKIVALWTKTYNNILQNSMDSNSRSMAHK